MIPILHRPVSDLINDSIEYDDISGQIMPLVDTTACKVTEKINGNYELSLEYPIGGMGWDLITAGSIIIVKDCEGSRQTQPYTVTQISKSGTKLSVKAQHISYRLKACIAPRTTSGMSTLKDVRDWLNNSAIRCPFTFYSDVSTAIEEPIVFDKPQSIYGLIYSGSNSLMKSFSGLFEMAFNRLNVSFSAARGNVKDFKIKYGVNMLSLTQAIEPPDQYKYIFPYAFLEKNATDKTKMYIDFPSLGITNLTDTGGTSYQNMAYAADVTDLMKEHGIEYYDEFAARSLSNRVSILNMRAAIWARRNQLPLVPSALTVSYIDLARSAEYSMQPTPISIGDVVTVEYPQYNISEQTEITSVTYDVLKERNESITIGTPNPTIVEKIAAKLQEGKI